MRIRVKETNLEQKLHDYELIEPGLPFLDEDDRNRDDQEEISYEQAQLEAMTDAPFYAPVARKSRARKKK